MEIVVPATPTELGSLAVALIRVAVHSPQCTLIVDPLHWRLFAENLSAASQQAQGLRSPLIAHGDPEGIARDPRLYQVSTLSEQINRQLDFSTLARIDEAIGAYLATGRDPSSYIGFKSAPNLRLAMRHVWADWKTQFDGDGALLARFLRLMICAVDDDSSADAARVLIGPEKIGALVRGTAVALVIATDWQGTAPHNTGPGNLLRQRPGAQSWTGHGCAAEKIDGEQIAICAANYMWKTQFVILSVYGSLDLAADAEEAFSIVDGDQPRLNESGTSGRLIMTIDREFIAAAGEGPAAIHELLRRKEELHYLKLEKAIAKPDRVGAI